MDLRERLVRKDLVAIGGGIVVLIVLAGLGVAPIIAIAAALVAYAALALVRSRSGGEPGSSAGDAVERSEVAYETSLLKIAGMRESAARLERESTREIVLRTCDHADRVMATMAERNARNAAPLFLEQLLEPAEALLDTYVHLSSRGLKATDELRARYESQDFPMIERAARLFLDRLRQDPTDLGPLTQLLSFNVDTETQIVQPRRTS